MFVQQYHRPHTDVITGYSQLCTICKKQEKKKKGKRKLKQSSWLVRYLHAHNMRGQRMSKCKKILHIRYANVAIDILY